MNFVVRTRDVDGSDRRSYKTRSAAVKRFEEMSGLTLQQAIDERYWETAPERRPTPDNVTRVRAVSNYGTVVEFEQKE